MESATAVQTISSWNDTLNLPASSETLNMLLSGTIAGLCVPQFLTLAECSALADNAREYEFNRYLNVVPRIDKVGITVFEFDQIGKSKYFEGVDAANRSISRITNGICSPLQRVLDWLSALAPHCTVGVANEPGYGAYFAGLLRRIEEGTLVHVDFAPMEQPGWSVAQVCSQLTFNLYLETPDRDPGVVCVWQKQLQPEHQIYKLGGSYGYDPAVVADAACATITPQTGMLMVINTRNFHQVSPAAGYRLAFSAAVGQLPNKDLVLWS
ncbi:MAG TPA: hypothetical protein VHN74_03010 [Candidatus Angelobacter sp.]|jgi:hypothetical protein|nr:hypothetical protein [Candidatus Angelobacter sp.]